MWERSGKAVLLPAKTQAGRTGCRLGYFKTMSVKKGQTITVEVTDMAFGGQGVARVDGLAVFVDHAVTGDRGEVLVVKKKKNFASGRLVNLLEPSPLRVKPPCPYEGFCGGCKWQFVRYDPQVEFKQRHVKDSLERIGFFENPKVLPTLPSPEPFGYRNKMEFSVSDRRWLLPSEMGEDAPDTGFALGLHVPGAFNKVLDIDACLLQKPVGNEILNEVRRYMIDSGLPPYGLKSHEGFWRFLMLRHSLARDQWMVNIITSEANEAALAPLAARLMAAHPEIASVVNNITARKAGIAVGEVEAHLAGEPVITDRIGDFTFEISANSFFQTNTAGAKTLYDTVKEYAALTGKEDLLDLYCGAGTIGIYLSGGAKSIVGLEMNESAIADGRKNRERNRVDNLTFIPGDIKTSLASVTHRPNVMVIDPPRAGMHKDVVKRVLDMGAPKIVYVSCNPATLARDLLVLKDGYQLVEVRPVDLFPHTWHIESVALLEAVSKSV